MTALAVNDPKKLTEAFPDTPRVGGGAGGSDDGFVPWNSEE